MAIELEPLVPAVVPPAAAPPVVPPVLLLPLDDELLSIVPVTSTFLFVFEESCDCADPGSSTYVVPELELLEPEVAPPAVAPPAVVPPAVEPALGGVRLVPDELPLDMLAFVRMKDAALPLPDVERDVLVPPAAVPPVDPVVPVAPLESPCCRQPTTVTVPLFAAVCWDPAV
ncbi:MAG TPA: hypothetical protein VKD69_24905 [Vicinamibacterales bacterium]|nr:hypothetical protein [Vicinamibacterales bacterium]